MKQFEKILFFADGARGERGALERALMVAADHGASVTLVDVVKEVGTNAVELTVLDAVARLQAALIKERTEALKALVKEIAPKRVKVTCTVLPGKDFIEVIRLAVQGSFDLVVKAANRGSRVNSLVFGSTDVRLMRKCPVPVWIIKPSRRKTVRKILAAVDPVPENRAAVNLNGKIMELAGLMAELEQADLHVLHAWEFPIDNVHRQRFDKDAFEELAHSFRDDSEHKLGRLLARYPDFQMEDHLLRGQPDKVIPKFVKDEGIDLLVMGTVVRTGIPGFLIGNTAERVLDDIDCSVLTLKPSGWRSPVK